MLDFEELVLYYCALFFCVKVTEVEWGIQVMMPQAIWLGSSKRVKISVLLLLCEDRAGWSLVDVQFV